MGPVNSNSEKNILNNRQVYNSEASSEDSAFSDSITLIAKIAIPILAAVALFAAIPFVSGVGAPVGLALTGLFFIALGILSLLTGEGLEKLKAWGNVQQAEADKVKLKQKIDLEEPVIQKNVEAKPFQVAKSDETVIQKNTGGDKSNSDMEAIKSDSSSEK